MTTLAPPAAVDARSARYSADGQPVGAGQVECDRRLESVRLGLVKPTREIRARVVDQHIELGEAAGQRIHGVVVGDPQLVIVSCRTGRCRSPPAAGFVPVMVTRAPASRNSVAVACPMPLVPPVISAVVPVKSKLTRAVMSTSISASVSQARSQKFVVSASSFSWARLSTSRAPGWSTSSARWIACSGRSASRCSRAR